MKLFKLLLVQLPLVMCLVLVPLINASATDIPVYKGVLRVLIVAEREGNTLLLQYRSKTRQVLRVGVRGVAMTNNLTHQLTRLPDASTSLADGLDKVSGSGGLVNSTARPSIALFLYSLIPMFKNYV